MSTKITAKQPCIQQHQKFSWQSRQFTKAKFVIAASAMFVLLHSEVLAQKGTKQNVFDAWTRRAEKTAKLSVNLELETKTQAGFYLQKPERSKAYLPYPIEDSITRHRYRILLDSPDRHRIESEGPRFKGEAFAGIQETRMDVQTADNAKSIWTTSAFEDIPEICRVTSSKKFESDKTFELLPLYLVYRPFDGDLNKEHPLRRFEYARKDKFSGKDVIVFALEVEGRLQECWIDDSGNNLLLRYRQAHRESESEEWDPLIDIKFRYGEPLKDGVPRLASWHTLYTTFRPPVGTLRNEMSGAVSELEIPDVIDSSTFDLKLPQIHVMSDRTNNEDYLQLENGERLPIKYSLEESGSRTISRIISSAKK